MKDETRSFYELAVTAAIERVVAGLDGALDLEGLARGAGMSQFHFHRVFRGMVGETPLELHRRLRLERAAWQLLFEKDPVTRVAFDAGYETHESFTRAFRLAYGSAPSEWRQRSSSDSAAAACSTPLRIELAAPCRIHFVKPGDREMRVQIQYKGETTMNVNIKQVPNMRVATVRHVGPYNQISEAFARLGAIAAHAGLFGPEAAMLAIYHDDPETTSPADLRSDAGIVVGSNATLPPELGEQHIEEGRYAVTKHIGPYEQLGDAWTRFMGQWLPQSGHRMRENGVSFEIYRNTPATSPPDKLETELYVPLA